MESIYSEQWCRVANALYEAARCPETLAFIFSCLIMKGGGRNDTVEDLPDRAGNSARATDYNVAGV